MRKTTISILLTLLFFLFAGILGKDAYAQGQFRCTGTSGLCTAENISCLTGWTPSNDYCDTTIICGGTFDCFPAPGFGGKNQPCREGPAGTQCDGGMICNSSGRCNDANPPSSQQGGSTSGPDISGSCGDGYIDSAIGCIPFGSTNDLAAFFLRFGIGIGGGIAFLLIIFASYTIMTSSGDPKRLQGGRELLTSAIAGLLMLIFSIFILRILGVNILRIF